jgi:hypothetical protein
MKIQRKHLQRNISEILIETNIPNRKIINQTVRTNLSKIKEIKVTPKNNRDHNLFSIKTQNKIKKRFKRNQSKIRIKMAIK